MDRPEPRGLGGEADHRSRRPAPPDGSPAIGPDDPVLAFLRVRYRPPAPDPAFAARLEETLMATPTASTHPPLPAPGVGASLPTPASPFPRRVGPWLASAALVLLTLAAILAARAGGPTGPGGAPTSVPAFAASPSVAATPRPDDALAAFVWESGGDPNRTFSNPGHLTLAPDGNLWVPDNGHDRFQILSPDGAFLEAWGTSGSGDGEFNFKDAGFAAGMVAFAPDGSYYVSDPGNYRIQKFAPDRSFVGAWGTEGGGPGQFKFLGSLAVGRDGRVYAIDGGRHDIQVFDADGAYLGAFGEQGAGDGQFLLSQGADLAVDPDGNLWVSDTSNYRLQVFSPDGDLLNVVSGGAGKQRLGLPYQVAFDASGRIFVATNDPNAIRVFAPDGALLGEWGTSSAADVTRIDLPPGTLLSPFGLALDGAGNVYVVDLYREVVVKFRLQPMLAATPTI